MASARPTCWRRSACSVPGRGLRGAAHPGIRPARAREGPLPWAARRWRFRGPSGEFDIGTGTRAARPNAGFSASTAAPAARRKRPSGGRRALADPGDGPAVHRRRGDRRRFLDRLVLALEPRHAHPRRATRRRSARNKLLADAGRRPAMAVRAQQRWLSMALQSAGRGADRRRR